LEINQGIIFPDSGAVTVLKSTICLWWSKYARLSIFIVRTAKTVILKRSTWLCLVIQSFFLTMIGVYLFEQCFGCGSHQSELGCPQVSLINIFFVATSEHLKFPCDFPALW